MLRSCGVETTPAAVAHPAEAHQHRGLELPALHVRVEIGPARDEHGLRPVVGHQLHRVGHRHRRQVPEGRQAHHDANGLTDTSSAGSPKADSTTFGSGKVNTGSRSGPRRPGLPCRLPSIALTTFSAVIGVSSMRTPTASYTAFATAGMTGTVSYTHLTLPTSDLV